MFRKTWIWAGCLAAGLASAAPDDFDAALAKGRNLLREGQYRLAEDRFLAAWGKAANPAQQALAQGWMGLAMYRMHQGDQADALLRKALAGGQGGGADRARWTAVLADIQAARGQTEAARRSFAEALPLAAGNPALQAGIRLGQAKLFPPAERLAALKEIAASLANLEPKQERAQYLVNLGTQATRLGESGERLGYESFEAATQLPGAPARERAEAFGGLARLYQARQRTDEALRLNAEAVHAAEAAGARDLLANLEWQTGRLQEARRQRAESLAAYRRAVDHIEAIRPDLPVEYHDGRSSFRETLGPFYLEYASLLLDQARDTNGDEGRKLLRESRDAVERVKQSELEDFLGGRCAVQGARRTELESLDPKTAILYPIIFPDRLEILVSAGSQLQAFSSAVDAKTVEQTAQNLAASLRDKLPDAKEHAQRLYHWLVEPAEPWLQRHRTDTLVIVPDGALRLVPLAALHDGRHYLVERYAVATSPGLSLFEAARSGDGPKRALLAGMSEPGPVVDRLPRVFFEAMAGHSPDGEKLRLGNSDADFEAMKRSPEFRRSLASKLVLPGVDREIAGLEKKVDSKAIVNETFTVEGFGKELAANPYSIVHIASHGVFGPTPESSFVMAYDGVIDIGQFQRLLKAEKLKNNPIELLILSACQTAEGDDRSPLGLSGVAIRSNVRSAMGSLWPVSDEAAYRLMEGFYAEFGRPGTTKAEALRAAQKALLADPRFEHPFYWSPFILVGNWL